MRKLLILICVFSVFSQCTKFEDGRNFSFRSVDRRLEKFSPWIFEKLEVDGVDKSAEFRADSSFFLELRFNIPRSRGSDELSLESTSNICYSLGEYKFTKPNKMKIYLLEYGGCSPQSIFDYYHYGPIFRDYWIE